MTRPVVVTTVLAGAAWLFVVWPETTVAQGCDTNYSGACVPIATDVDCAAGTGNGPAYVAGPILVVGRDVYGLDRDGDGVGCERG